MSKWFAILAAGILALTACGKGGNVAQPPTPGVSAPSAQSGSLPTSPSPGAVPGEGGQGEAAQRAREAEKKFYEQTVHPGGKPAKDFVRFQGPGAWMHAYCGSVDGKLPSFPVIGSNGNENGGMTGKWDIGMHSADGIPPRDDSEDCMTAMKLFADLFASAPDSQGPLTVLSGPNMNFRGISLCYTTEGLGVPYISCGVNRSSLKDSLIDDFVAFTRS
ncbi:hypothetical protein [Mycobacterium gordonae]|uniref:hypothetical protein n=1 Tax=Mycobacterium gordonae TaxID=1778 RepID=UPI001356644C|nr:hypothetical protein [Mycobacterium gordonae]